MMLRKAEADVMWATAREMAMARQTDKPQAVRMFSVNDLENCYHLYLNDKLNYFNGLLKKVHTKIMEIENLWSIEIMAFDYSTQESSFL